MSWNKWEGTSVRSAGVTLQIVRSIPLFEVSAYSDFYENAAWILQTASGTDGKACKAYECLEFDDNLLLHECRRLGYQESQLLLVRYRDKKHGELRVIGASGGKRSVMLGLAVVLAAKEKDGLNELWDQLIEYKLNRAFWTLVEAVLENDKTIRVEEEKLHRERPVQQRLDIEPWQSPGLTVEVEGVELHFIGDSIPVAAVDPESVFNESAAKLLQLASSSQQLKVSSLYEYLQDISEEHKVELARLGKVGLAENVLPARMKLRELTHVMAYGAYTKRSSMIALFVALVIHAAVPTAQLLEDVREAHGDVLGEACERLVCAVLCRRRPRASAGKGSNVASDPAPAPTSSAIQLNVARAKSRDSRDDDIVFPLRSSRPPLNMKPKVTQGEAMYGTADALQWLQGHWLDCDNPEKVYEVKDEWCMVHNADPSNRTIKGTSDAWHRLLIKDGEIFWGLGQKFVLHWRHGGSYIEWMPHGSVSKEKRGFWWKRTTCDAKPSIPTKNPAITCEKDWSKWTPSFSTSLATPTLNPQARNTDFKVDKTTAQSDEFEWPTEDVFQEKQTSHWKAWSPTSLPTSQPVNMWRKIGAPTVPSGEFDWGDDESHVLRPRSYEDSFVSGNVTLSRSQRERDVGLTRSGLDSPAPEPEAEASVGVNSEPPPSPDQGVVLSRIDQELYRSKLHIENLTPKGGVGATWVVLRKVMIRDTEELDNDVVVSMAENLETRQTVTQLEPWRCITYRGADVIRMFISFERHGHRREGYVTVQAGQDKTHVFLALAQQVLPSAQMSFPDHWPHATANGVFCFTFPEGLCGAVWVALSDIPLHSVEDTQRVIGEVKQQDYIWQLERWKLDDGGSLSMLVQQNGSRPPFIDKPGGRSISLGGSTGWIIINISRLMDPTQAKMLALVREPVSKIPFPHN